MSIKNSITNYLLQPDVGLYRLYYGVKGKLADGDPMDCHCLCF